MIAKTNGKSMMNALASVLLNPTVLWINRFNLAIMEKRKVSAEVVICKRFEWRPNPSNDVA